MKFINSMPARIELNKLSNGSGQLIINHPKTRCPMMMFLIYPGSLPLAERAIKAYHNGDGDADAFFIATGMADADAFNKETWS